MNLVENIINIKSQIDQKSPKRFSHLGVIGSKADNIRQKEIDVQNQFLLEKIMNIMKRRNTTVENARQKPQLIIGGSNSIIQK